MTNTCRSLQSVAPAYFVGHGGGPFPILQQNDVFRIKMQSIASTKLKSANPRAIVVVTAHWITGSGSFSVASGIKPSLYFDYSGFPKESYELQYNAPGDPVLADQIRELLVASGIPCTKDEKRSWDHGVFVPLMLLYPEAKIPVVALSISSNMDPSLHIRVGKALSKLRESNVTIIGSGNTFHNIPVMFSREPALREGGIAASKAFDTFLVDTVTSTAISNEERAERLVQWTTAPGALLCQPRGKEDHLIPLHVLVGCHNCDAGTHLGTVQFEGFHHAFFEF